MFCHFAEQNRLKKGKIAFGLQVPQTPWEGDDIILLQNTEDWTSPWLFF
jgi:hypothetical protein